MRAIDEMLDRLSFENESVASEVPWTEDVLQVHPKVSLQPTEKEEVCFLFRGPGGLGIQRVHGGASLEEWGCKGEAREEVWMDTLPLLGRRILNPGREVSGLGLDGLQEVVFNGRLRSGAVGGGGKAEVPNIGEWQCTFCGAVHCWNTRFSCYMCGTPRFWEFGVLGQGGLGGVPGKGGSVGAGIVGKESGWGVFFFFGQGGAGSAMGGMRVVGPTGRDQTYAPQGEPTFRKGGGAKGGEKGAGGQGGGEGTVASWSCPFAEGPGSWCSEGVGGGSWAGGGVAGYAVGGGVFASETSLSCPCHTMRRWWPAFMSCTPLKRG